MLHRNLSTRATPGSIKSALPLRKDDEPEKRRTGRPHMRMVPENKHSMPESGWHSVGWG